MDKVLELKTDGTITLVAQTTNDNQKWTRNTVDEFENWFIWSNKAEDTKSKNKFLAAPDMAQMMMKGIIILNEK